LRLQTRAELEATQRALQQEQQARQDQRRHLQLVLWQELEFQLFLRDKRESLEALLSQQQR
jgi:hypothetical protein